VICIGYGIYSSIRRTLAISLPLLLQELSLSKSDIGIISSNFSIAYGFSKFLWSIACDTFNCKHLFIFGLISTSLLCVAFTFGTTVEYLSMIWFLNGCIQGIGWPALASIIFENFDVIHRGTAWSAATSVSFLTPPTTLTLARAAMLVISSAHSSSLRCCRTAGRFLPLSLLL
jgi:sugar phosphate permease